MKSLLQRIYPVSFPLLPDNISCPQPEQLPKLLVRQPELCREAPFLADLATVELAAYQLSNRPAIASEEVRRVHPGLDLVAVSWQGLPELLAGQGGRPVPGEGFVLLQAMEPGSYPKICTPGSHDLLALKIVTEAIPSREAARIAGVPIGVIDDILWAAEGRGLLLAPASRLVRPESFARQLAGSEELLQAQAFTLQWHLTQACDLHCRHCYDRRPCREMSLTEGVGVLDQLYDFCQARHVYGQVSFTGGNPLLAEHFYQFYRGASERGLLTAILGNPADRATLEKILAIKKPEFFQVSLEGLPDHNDYIRGVGHFDRVLAFLDLLGEMGIFSMVMLTLTRANLEQVLPLAELLRHRVDLFSFNRLAMVGEGAALASVPPKGFRHFLAEYLEAAENNPVIRLKENLFNLLGWQQGHSVGGGCAGFGCGAAFNFVALLPDGVVHACRKLPSPLGNIRCGSLAEIYDSPLAERYRLGSSACRDCPIRPACGGCLAVSHGFGLDIFSALDPYCFRE